MDRSLHIGPTEIQIGDVITSDPRRDFHVDYTETDDFGGTTIYTSDGAKAYICPDQTVTVQRGEG